MKKIKFILLIGLLVACGKEIEITNEHVLNEYWDNSEKTNNSIRIQKMKVIDSSLNIFNKEFVRESNHWNIVNKLEIDSSFYCSYYGLSISEKEADEIDKEMRKDEGLRKILLEKGIDMDTLPKITRTKRKLLSQKVYFNKDNGWNWNVNGIRKQTIGNLKNSTWYKFSELTMNNAYYKYVYVDSIGQTHVFNVNLANY